MTASQIKKLVDLSGLQNEDLKKATVNEIIRNGVTRPISKLISLLGHPCAQAEVEKYNSEFKKKYKSYEDQGVLNEIGMNKPNKEELIESYSKAIATVIGLGFDVALKDNLNVNSVTGEITVKRDASGNPDTRFLECAKAEIPPPMPSSSSSTASESDPYKGSQQGLGRTRKQKKRSKKTLRRRKVRRNVH